MPVSDAQLKASAKYHSKFSDIKIRVPNDGTRERYQEFAQTLGKSLNAYVIDLIEQDIAAHAAQSQD